MSNSELRAVARQSESKRVRKISGRGGEGGTKEGNEPEIRNEEDGREMNFKIHP